MFDETVYRSMNERIVPEASLIENVRLRSGRYKGAQTRGLRAHTVRKIIPAAALILCLCFAAPALAVNSPAVYRLMYAVSPAVAQFFVPVREACEDNGVRMEVVSACVHGDTAEIYITMQDLTGERIDETTDLFDSEQLHIPFDSVGTCRRVDYRAETRTATFLIEISTMSGARIPGGKVTFSVGCFLSDKQEFPDMPVPLNWSTLPNNAQTRPVYCNGFSCRSAEPMPDPCDKDGMIDALLPGEAMCTPLDGFEISAAGYLPDGLHVQLSAYDTLKNDNHAELYLKDASGQTVYADFNYAFWRQNDESGSIQCVEFVFPVSKDALASHALYGNFWKSGLLTEGNWRVTFPLAAGGGQ